MNIAIDIRSLVNAKKSGIPIYIENLILHLQKNIPRKSHLFLFCASWKFSMPNSLKNLKTDKKISVLHLKIPSKIFNPLIKFAGRYLTLERLIKIFTKTSIDTFIFPNLMCLSPVSEKTKKIVIVHDTSFVYFPEFFNLKQRVWYKFINPRKQLHDADLIITDSESTKNDVKKIYKIPGNIIEILHPISTSKSSQIKNNLSNKNYILYFGTIEPRKNIINIIRAFEYLKKDRKFKSLKLFICGSKGWKNNQIYQIRRKSKFKKSIYIRTNIKEGKKNQYYQNARVVVYPSFFEGYGLPPLEAMQHEIPVITSNNSSLSEVVKNNALTVNAYRTQELVKALKIVLTKRETLSKQITYAEFKLPKNFYNFWKDKNNG